MKIWNTIKDNYKTGWSEGQTFVLLASIGMIVLIIWGVLLISLI
jgi:hypothetical protein